MQNEFEQPGNAPVSTRTESPVKMKLEYKPGKTPAQYAKHANPKQDEKIGFLYYDKDLKRNVKMDKVTLFTVGVYSQIAGAVKITEKEYRNYQTNLVEDTRQDIMVLREAFVQNSEILCKGVYRTVKNFVDENPKQFQGVGYRMVMVAYCRELDKIVHLECSQRLQYALKKSIANATKERVDKVSLLGLTSISSEIWGFVFAGDYSLVNEKDEPYTDRGDLYCAPILSCGVIKATTKNFEEIFSYVSSVQDQMGEYISGQQSYYNSDASNATRSESSTYFAEPAPVSILPPAPPANDFEPPVTFDDSLPF